MQGGGSFSPCILYQNMILGCVIFYDDEPNLIERCFQSLKRTVDRIIAIDGAYREYPHDKPYSTNGCLDIAKRYADRVIETKEAWRDQATKRNQYLVLENEFDYYFILDTDEKAIGSIPRILKEDVYKIYFERPTVNGNLMGEYCRLIRHQKGIGYYKKHNLLVAGGKILSYPSPVIPLIDKNKLKVIHYSDQRSNAKIMADGEYLRNRSEEKTYVDFGKLDRIKSLDESNKILQGVL